MGQILSRVSQLFPVATNDRFRNTTDESYLNIPSFGSYFANFFFLGGGRFENILPEAFLFGEISDLNFLNSKPVPFPYPSPLVHEPTKALHSFINIRKDSVKLVKCESSNKVSNAPSYNLEFTYDLEVPCIINIHLFCKEECSTDGLKYTSQRPDLIVPPISCSPIKGDLFNCPQFVIEPTVHSKESWSVNPMSIQKDTIIPLVISITTQPEFQEVQQQTTLCSLENSSEGGHYLKVLKQKCVIEGVTYILQEIYGLENKGNSLEEIISPKPHTVNAAGDNLEEEKGSSEDLVNTNSECVVCMCEAKDTLILPCRHLCLCADCARSLRYQSSNCPICRAPFRALLQLKGLHRSDEIPREPDLSDVSPNSDTSIGGNTSLVNQLTEESASRLLDIVHSESVESVQVLAAGEVLDEEEEEDIDVPSGFKTVAIVSQLKPSTHSSSESEQTVSIKKRHSSLHASRAGSDSAKSLTANDSHLSSSRLNTKASKYQLRKGQSSGSMDMKTMRYSFKNDHTVSQEAIPDCGGGGAGNSSVSTSSDSSPSSDCNLLVNTTDSADPLAASLNSSCNSLE